MILRGNILYQLTNVFLKNKLYKTDINLFPININNLIKFKYTSPLNNIEDDYLVFLDESGFKYFCLTRPDIHLKNTNYFVNVNNSQKVIFNCCMYKYTRCNYN